MKVQVHITIQSDEGQAEVVHEVARLERGPVRPDALGLSLAEARSILAGLERTMAEGQAAEFVAQGRRCSRCGRERACKGHHQIESRRFRGVRLKSIPVAAGKLPACLNPRYLPRQFINCASCSAA